MQWVFGVLYTKYTILVSIKAFQARNESTTVYESIAIRYTATNKYYYIKSTKQFHPVNQPSNIVCHTHSISAYSDMPNQIFTMIK